ncbi:MAG: formylglycine-generating enzyme family protein [Planctomycetota bacterium]
MFRCSNPSVSSSSQRSLWSRGHSPSQSDKSKRGSRWGVVCALFILTRCGGGGGGGGGGVAARAPITGTYSVSLTVEQEPCDPAAVGDIETDVVTIEIVDNDGHNGNVRISDDTGVVFLVGTYSASTGRVDLRNEVMINGELHVLSRPPTDGELQFAFETNPNQLSFTGSVNVTGPCPKVLKVTGSMMLVGPPVRDTLPLLVQAELFEGISLGENPTPEEIMDGFFLTQQHEDYFQPSCAGFGNGDFAVVFEASVAGQYLFSTLGSDPQFDTVLARFEYNANAPGLEIPGTCEDSAFLTSTELLVTLAANERTIVVLDGAPAVVSGVDPYGRFVLSVERTSYPGLTLSGTNPEGYREYTLDLDPTVVLILIPGGTFMMGTAAGLLAEMPAHQVTLSPYFIAKYEITNAQYKRYCDATMTPYPPEPSPGFLTPSYFTNPSSVNFPVVMVSWNDVQGYLTWAGLTLPTEAQWEFAACWTDGRIYPWGNEAPDAGGVYRASYCAGTFCFFDGWQHTSPVDAFDQFAGPFGTRDQSGNVQEWCQDRYGAYTSSPAVDPTGPAIGSLRVVRGGYWFDAPFQLRGRHRIGVNPTDRHSGQGFRAARVVPR